MKITRSILLTLLIAFNCYTVSSYGDDNPDVDKVSEMSGESYPDNASTPGSGNFEPLQIPDNIKEVYRIAAELCNNFSDRDISIDEYSMKFGGMTLGKYLTMRKNHLNLIKATHLYHQQKYKEALEVLFTGDTKECPISE